MEALAKTYTKEMTLREKVLEKLKDEKMNKAELGLAIQYSSIKCQVLLYKKSYIKMYNYSDAWI